MNQETNNKLFQVIKNLVPLSMWLEVRFLTYAYEENLIGREEFTLWTAHIFRRSLITTNISGNFVPKLQNFKTYLLVFLIP
jgi:hypothetical protein